MPIQLYNTLTRQKEPFVPGNPERVTMYVCGPTVYSYAHIGNGRSAVVFDVLARLLRFRFPELRYARNITDVDDKINKAAWQQGIDIRQLTTKFAEIYNADMAALGVQRPDLEPRVTDNMAHIIGIIERLIATGHAYEAEGHVLFATQSFAGYGQLSRRQRDDMLAGARVEVAPYKRDDFDFVLWKPSTPDLPGWDSPWGRGRPGWHIECTAMIDRYFHGETIDIHGGGADLIFPHHENEIAQGTCAHAGQPYARFWLHNGFVNIQNEETRKSEKMSKSLGNVLLVHELLALAPPEAIRWAMLSAHYRAPMDWSVDLLEQARKNLDRLYGTLRELSALKPTPGEQQPTNAFVEALEDDLNLALAFAELFRLAKAANSSADPDERRRLKGQLLAGGELVGLLQQDPEAWFAGDRGAEGEVPADDIEAAIAARAAARQARDFAEADRIRDDLAARGVIIEDRPGGTIWRRA